MSVDARQLMDQRRPLHAEVATHTISPRDARLLTPPAGGGRAPPRISLWLA